MDRQFVNWRLGNIQLRWLFVFGCHTVDLAIR